MLKITGPSRFNLSLSLEANGTYNTQNEFKLKGKEIPNLQTLKNILFESRHIDMFSPNYLIDAVGMYWNEKMGEFVQSIGLNPFGALMTSKKQVSLKS
jgi:hypothetical protein